MNLLLKTFISFSMLTSTIFNVVFSNNVCSLCNNGAYLSEKHTELYGKEVKEDNILFECENFYIAIDNYPVCDYHILIIPKEHKCSYSEIDINLEFELESIIKTLSNILETEEYGLFEHGSNFVGLEQKSCGNSINHAHMHFIHTLNLTRKNLINLCTSGKEKNLIKLT